MIDIEALPIAAILFAANALVQAQDLDNGRTEFLSKCAECHGADGKGASPTTSKLKRKPADLTALARNNNGVFSAAAIAAIVDGRGPIWHRRLEMPIWGCRQGPPPAGKGKATKPTRLNRCWICLATLRRRRKNKSWRSSGICVEFKRNRCQEPTRIHQAAPNTAPASTSAIHAYDAAAPTAGFRAGGVQR